jgi:sec-independent protein translocase protein TatB
MAASVKEEIKLELQAEELRQIFKEQSGLDDAQHLLDETSSALNATLAQSPINSAGQHEFK